MSGCGNGVDRVRVAAVRCRGGQESGQCADAMELKLDVGLSSVGLDGLRGRLK